MPKKKKADAASKTNEAPEVAEDSLKPETLLEPEAPLNPPQTTQEAPKTSESSKASELSEIESLKEEVAALVAQNSSFVEHQAEASSQMKPPKGRARTRGALALVVIAVVLLAVAVPTAWFKTTLLDVDHWVATVAPLAESPAVQKAVATKASSALITALDVERLAEEYLPSQAQPLAAPIASSIESLINQQALNLAESSRFASLWETLNRNGHPALVATLTGAETGSAVSSASGTITLDIGVVVDALKSTLVDRGFGLADRIPTSLFSRQIELYSSPALLEVQGALSLLERGIGGLLVAILILALAAFVLSKDRRKVALWLGMGTTIAMLISILAVNLGQDIFIASIPNLSSIDKAAALDAYNIILSNLIVVQRLVAIVGLVVGIIALVLGNRTLKHALKNGLNTVAHKGRILPFCTWIKNHTRGVGAAGFIVIAILVLIPFEKTWTVLACLAVALFIWMMFIVACASIARLGSEVPDEQLGEQPDAV